MRARFVDQGALARPPGEGRRDDPVPPPLPGETSAGPSTHSEPVEPGEDGEKRDSIGGSDTNNEGNGDSGCRMLLG